MGDPAVQVNVLGPLEVVIDGAPIALPSRTQRSLLLRLAIDAGSPVPADALIDAIWGETLPKDPRNALRYHVWKLREALAAPGVVATAAGGYRLVAGDGQIDARRFERLVNGALTALDPKPALRDLDEALDLWRGRPYHDVVDEEFAQPDIRRLRELRRLAREERARRLLEVGREAEAIPELEALLEEHPHGEAAWSTMMKALYRVGRQSDALAAYQRARRLLGDDLGIEPTPELRRLEESVLLHDASLGRPAVVPTNLPLALTSFIGREGDTERVTNALASRRLVTIVGPGGAGKTRLAIECARAASDRFVDGNWIIDLTRLTAGEDVLEAVSQEIDVGRGEGDQGAGKALLTFLRNRRFLLVFDNCEHLPDAVADAVVAILERCAGGRVLATSRSALGIPGEHLVPLSGMECPVPGDDWDTVVASQAGQLFMERAADAGAGIPASAENAEIVGRICRLVEGMPLAIELAAARARTLPIADLGPQLSMRLSAYGEQRGTAQRHRTMDATIEWSYGLLDETARMVFRYLGAFVGGFTMDAAIRVCSGPRLTPDDVTAAIERLIDRSMVERLADAGPRLRLLEPFRLFALTRMEAAGEHERVVRAHAEAYADIAIGALEHQRGPLRNDVYQGLRNDSPNMRAALEWFEHHDRVDRMCRTVAAMTAFWTHDARAADQIRWARACEPRLDELEPDDAIRIRMLLAHATLYTGDAEEASGHMRLILDLATEVTDELVRADVITTLLFDLDAFNLPPMDPATQVELARGALDAYRRHGDRWGEVAALTATCNSMLWWRDGPRPEEVIPLARQAAEIAEEIGDVEGRIWALINEALALMADHIAGSAPSGDIVSIFDELFGLVEHSSSQEAVSDTFQQAAWFAFRNGDTPGAIELCERAAHIADDHDLLFSATSSYTALALFSEEHDRHLARRSIITGLRRAESRKVDRQTVWVVEVAARLLASWGEPELAARLIGAAEHLRTRDRNPMPSWDDETYKETVARIGSSCGRQYDALRSEGAAWSIREAANVAREALGDL